MIDDIRQLLQAGSFEALPLLRAAGTATASIAPIMPALILKARV
jgi:hypothetical protein